MRWGALVLIGLAASACAVSPVAAPPAGVSRSSAGAAPASGFPGQPGDVPYPTKDWPRGEWPAGTNRTAVDRVVDEAFAGGADQRVRGVAIVHHGRLIYERYSANPLDGADENMPSFSVAKSITSAAVGILVHQGKLTVTAPAGAPEWPAGDPRAAITLDDLLRMSSGLEWNEDTDIAASTGTHDAAKFVAERKLTHPPGTNFHYCTGCTFIVDRAMATALGGGARFTEFIKADLFGKLGMSVTLSYDDQGTWLGGYAAYARTLDYAKFGLLFLRDGIWDGQRILPPHWVDYSRTPSRTNAQYGSGWWLDPQLPGTFFAVGARGQVIGVDPGHDLTFVITSTDAGRSKPVSDVIMSVFASG
jgi:CubicO group peptidase (beta-lactamase class C family)